MLAAKVPSPLPLEVLATEMECLELRCCNFGKGGTGGRGGSFVGVLMDEEDLKRPLERGLCFGLGYMTGGDVSMKDKSPGENCGKEKTMVCRGMDTKERMLLVLC